MSASELDMVQALLDTGDLTTANLGALQFTAGSRIFAQGDAADCAYMIDQGYVEVSCRDGDKSRVVALLGPGEVFGEIAILDGLPRSATARALHETRVILIPRHELLSVIHNASPLAQLVVMASARRLRLVQSPGEPAVDRSTTESDPSPGFAPSYDASRSGAARHLRERLALDSALAKQEFALDYQPIVTLSDGRTAGFEALIRWSRRDHGVVAPSDFIPLAEETGLILPIGTWVLEQALLALETIDRNAARRRCGGADAFMSINVSPYQLESEENVEQLARMVEKASIDPSRIKFEITEQSLLRDPRMATISLARLKDCGASIAIDDFGTGYSSLSYLHRFPLDTLKVDQSFTAKLSSDANAQRIVAAIIALAKELGLNIVAEGIESRDEMHWLQSHACEFGQGYLMAKPSGLVNALRCLERPFEW